jgi:hypothetical protein
MSWLTKSILQLEICACLLAASDAFNIWRRRRQCDERPVPRQLYCSDLKRWQGRQAPTISASCFQAMVSETAQCEKLCNREGGKSVAAIHERSTEVDFAWGSITTPFHNSLMQVLNTSYTHSSTSKCRRKNRSTKAKSALPHW